MDKTSYFLRVLFLLCFAFVSGGNILADTTKPEVNFDEPANGAVVSGSVAVSAYASDDMGVSQAIFYVDGNQWRVDTAWPFGFTWDTKDVSDGSHTLSVEAYDSSDNKGTASITVTVANDSSSSNICTGYNYSAWSNCSSNGKQTRTILSNIPANCIATLTGSAIPLTEKNCTVCAYSCGDWGACSSGGKQTRTCTATPSGCVPSADTTYIPSLERSCCNYTCGDWGACSSGGKQTRTCVAMPSGCVAPTDSTPPALEQSCTYGSSCVYTYSDWGACSSSGKQTRTVKSTSPSGVVCTNDPILQQSCTYPTVCTYTCGNWGACGNGNIKTRTCTATPSGCAAPADASLIPATKQTCANNAVCVYTYSDWGGCSTSGQQTRTVNSTSPSGVVCTNDPILQQSCTYIGAAACTYTYGGWSTCGTNNIRTRTYTKSPAGCYTDSSNLPVVSQTCTNEAAACTYTYGDWSVCGVNGKQTRVVIKRAPDGCKDAALPLLEQSCVYVPGACMYDYSAWSDCSAAGKQTRTVVSKKPAGCTESPGPVLEQSCILPPCVYIYGSWGDCSPSGKQTRSVVSKTPGICKVVDGPVLGRECKYVAPKSKDEGDGDSGNANNENAGESDGPKELPPCSYKYSAWGDCVAETQSRIVTVKSPAECREAEAPLLIQACKMTSVPEPPRPEGAPKPVPESVLSLPEINQPHLNDRTSAAWQEYYFKSPECFDFNMCAGTADPDNDDLNNNDEYRFGTDPLAADTDHDGLVDSGEIIDGHDPLVKTEDGEGDEITREDPREKGEVKPDSLQVANVETIDIVGKGKVMKISGLAIPNTYVTIYLFSDPIVITVKSDRDGNWSYVLERTVDEGEHEVYVAVTDNTGKVTAKSTPLSFVQTAEASIITPPQTKKDRVAPPAKARLLESYLIFGAVGIAGLLLALAAIGMLKGRANNN